MAQVKPEAERGEASLDPGAARYPGSSDAGWSRRYGHRWLRRFERLGVAGRGHEDAWPLVKRRLRAMFNPRWIP